MKHWKYFVAERMEVDLFATHFNLYMEFIQRMIATQITPENDADAVRSSDSGADSSNTRALKRRAETIEVIDSSNDVDTTDSELLQLSQQLPARKFTKRSPAKKREKSPSPPAPKETHTRMVQASKNKGQLHVDSSDEMDSDVDVAEGEGSDYVPDEAMSEDE